MNFKNSILRAVSVSLLMILLLSLTACAKSVEIPVNYGGQSLVANGNEEMTVKELLGQLGISLN